VEETLVPGASVSRVTRRNDVNANQVFHWRKLYHEGRLGTTTNFLPVRVADEQRGEAVNGSGFIPQPGTMEIKLCRHESGRRFRLIWLIRYSFNKLRAFWVDRFILEYVFVARSELPL
jgi:hypothetical protein